MGLLKSGGIKFANSPTGRFAAFSRFWATATEKWEGNGEWLFDSQARLQPLTRHLQIPRDNGGIAFWQGFSETDTIVNGFAFRTNGPFREDASSAFLLFGRHQDPSDPNANALEMCRLEWSGDQFILKNIEQQTTLLASGPLPTDDEWHYFEIKVFFSASTGSAEMRLDEATIASASGLNTVNDDATGNEINEIKTHLNTNASLANGDPVIVRFGDVYIVDASSGAPAPNDFLGDCLTGSHLEDNDLIAEWEPAGGNHFALTDNEISPGHDGDQSYVFTSSSNADQDLYDTGNFQGLSSPEVFNVKVMYIARVTGGDLRRIKAIVRTDDTGVPVADSTVITFFDTVYRPKIVQMDTNPITGVAWTMADLYQKNFAHGFEHVP